MPYKSLSKICERCGAQFWDKSGHNTQRFCSVQCGTWGRHKPAEVPKRRRGVFVFCSTCGKQFYAKSSPSNVAKGRGKYCSKACKGIGSRRHPERPCLICGKVFTPGALDSKKYCSNECSNLGRAKNRKKGRDITCVECGKVFYAPKSRIEQGVRFCSVQCHNKSLNRYNASRGTFISGPEKIMAKLLDDAQINYIPQAVIGDLVCDFLIPDIQMVIEVDGDYWHANPDMFPNPPQHRLEQRERDRRRDWFLRRHKFSVIRVWESDVKNNHDLVIRKITERRAALIRHTAIPAAQ